jgi:large subunit ribosomal protein L4
LESHKTKELLSALAGLSLNGTTLIVTSTVDRNLSLASGNIGHVEVTTSDSLNTYQVLRPNKLVFTRSAFEKIEERMSQSKS